MCNQFYSTFNKVTLIFFKQFGRWGRGMVVIKMLLIQSLNGLCHTLCIFSKIIILLTNRRKNECWVQYFLKKMSSKKNHTKNLVKFFVNFFITYFAFSWEIWIQNGVSFDFVNACILLKNLLQVWIFTNGFFMVKVWNGFQTIRWVVISWKIKITFSTTNYLLEVNFDNRKRVNRSQLMI